MDNLPIEFTDNCWIWHGAGNRYGVITKNGITQTAHRYIYRLLVGEIPKDLQLDHLCEVKKCVNPSHLEPVTRLENMRRYKAKIGNQCKKGHEITGDNIRLYIYKGKEQRRCRQCANEYRRNKDRIIAKLRGARPYHYKHL